MNRLGLAASAEGMGGMKDMMRVDVSSVLPVGVGGSGSSYCRICMFYCPDSEQLLKHMETCGADAVEDSGERSASISSEKEKDSPVVSQPVDLQRPFRCSRCGRSYQLAQSLQRHRWKCDQSRPMPCSICGAVYFRADNLQSHIRCAHPDLC
jgi:DNA-directed RNA polymerase subunit RPC12/RpoP